LIGAHNSPNQKGNTTMMGDYYAWQKAVEASQKLCKKSKVNGKQCNILVGKKYIAAGGADKAGSCWHFVIPIPKEDEIKICVDEWVEMVTDIDGAEWAKHTGDYLNTKLMEAYVLPE
jgi:hypothetical protein